MKAKKSLLICILFSLFVFIGNKVYLDRALRNESIRYIAWDAYGYYLYLPAFIIHHDPYLKGNWPEKLNEKYGPTATFYQVTERKNDKRAIIYNIGYSICYLPAFLTGHAIAMVCGYDMDGMSPPYQISMLLFALLYNLLAIFSLRKLLISYFEDSITGLVLIVIFFGTNLYMSAGLSLAMPHNLLFLTNCLYLIYVAKWFNGNQMKDACIAGVLLGLNTIIRPTELILIVVPALWNFTRLSLWKEQMLYFWNNRKQVIVFICCVLVCVIIQFSYWYCATDSFQFNFHAQRLSLLDPYTFQFLFSYKKGWLLYTPVMLLGLFSFYYIYKFKKNIFGAFTAYTVLIIYALSSWECWWYAASFGQRPMVESYPFFAIGFGCFFVGLNEYTLWKKAAAYTIIIFFIVLNIFQTWQYTAGIIDPERMTKKYYWKIFGKTQATDEDRKSLSVDRGVYVQTEFKGDGSLFTKKLLINDSYEEAVDTNLVSTVVAHSGSKSIRLDSVHAFSPTFAKEYYAITSKDYVWLRASVWVYMNDSVITSKNDGVLAVFMDSRGMTNQYSKKSLADLGIAPRVWTQVQLDYLTPAIKHSDDKIIVNFWNTGGEEIFVDDLEIEVLEPKEDSD